MLFISKLSLQVRVIVVHNNTSQLELIKISYDHYENISMQYTAIFHGSKNEKFEIKKMIIFLCLLKT